MAYTELMEDQETILLELKRIENGNKNDWRKIALVITLEETIKELQVCSEAANSIKIFNTMIDDSDKLMKSSEGYVKDIKKSLAPFEDLSRDDACSFIVDITGAYCNEVRMLVKSIEL